MQNTNLFLLFYILQHKSNLIYDKETTSNYLFKDSLI